MSNDSTQVQGTVHAVLPLQSFDSGFTKRVLVIKTDDDKYPQFIPIEFIKDKTSLIADLQEGQALTAHVNLRGNEFKRPYYASVQGWRLDIDGQEQHAQSRPQAQANPAPATTHELADDGDDIPF